MVDLQHSGKMSRIEQWYISICTKPVYHPKHDVWLAVKYETSYAKLLCLDQSLCVVQGEWDLPEGLSMCNVVVDVNSDQVLALNHDQSVLSKQSFVITNENQLEPLGEILQSTLPQCVGYVNLIKIDHARGRVIALSDRVFHVFDIASLNHLFCRDISPSPENAGYFNAIWDVEIDEQCENLVMYSHCFHITVFDPDNLDIKICKALPGADIRSICIDHQQRIAVVRIKYSYAYDCYCDCEIEALSIDLQHISSYRCPTVYEQIAYDRNHGRFALINGSTNMPHILDANIWLPNTYVWCPINHRYAPNSIRRAVATFTMLRSLQHQSAISLLPNELLFEIFQHL